MQHLFAKYFVLLLLLYDETMVRQGREDLIFVEFTVLVLLFTLVLEGDDDEADEDVDHEERDDDNVDEVEDGDDRSMVVNRAVVGRVRVHAFIHQSV